MLKKFDVLFDLIQNADNILITGHKSPDGDCVCSMLSMGELLDSLNKNYKIYHADSIPSFLKFLPNLDKIEKKDSFTDVFDLVITVDTPSAERMVYPYLPSQMKTLVVIDHHLTNTGFGDYNFIFSSIGSTCEVIYDFFEEINFPINKDIAEILFTGIATDTGYFQFSCASSRTFRIAADLIDKGVSHNKIFDYVWKNKSLEFLRLIASLILQIKYEEKYKLGWLALNKDLIQKYNLDENKLSEIINQLISINGLEVAVIFEEFDDFTVCEFRSRSEFPVHQVAKFFGGGGHFNASGCTIHKPFEEAQEYVIKELKRMIVDFYNQKRETQKKVLNMM
jgi:phosphoesterase RecJ-like protein